MAVTELRPTGRAAGRPMEWLEAEICTLAGHIAAAECRFLCSSRSTTGAVAGSRGSA